MLSVSLIQGTNFSVTIRVRPLLQYFYVVQLVSQHFTKRNLEFLMLTVASSGNEQYLKHVIWNTCELLTSFVFLWMHTKETSRDDHVIAADITKLGAFQMQVGD